MNMGKGTPIPPKPTPPCESAWRCPSGYPKGSWGCRNWHIQPENQPVRLGETARPAEGEPRP